VVPGEGHQIAGAGENGAAVGRTQNGGYPPALGCSSMALDTSGRFLLVPYLVSHLNPADSYSGGSLRTAVINTATGARSAWTLRFGEDNTPGSMTIAW
jgi:hypothetical protein